jgi:nitroimidazol reductase NimA-like FMN-containing flavoprotein (pyridoxamine 5'-phosphate oxidase superfamily)
MEIELADTSDVPAADTAPSPCAERALTEDEVRQVVARNFIGVLATVGDDQPYAVPFIYGYDGHAFFALLGQGRKVRNMERNPRICITIVEHDDDASCWRSVLAVGKASRVEGLVKLGHALNAIRKQYPGNPMRSAPPLSALKGYYMLRVDVDELTGTRTAMGLP